MSSINGHVEAAGARSLTAGQPATISVTTSGEARVDTSHSAPSSLDYDWGTVTKQVAKASAGRIRGLVATNANASTRYFQIHNKATAPAGTNVPVYSFPVVTGGTLTLGTDFFGDGGASLSAGVSWAWSTTLATFTDSATAANHTTHVHYT